MADTLLKCNLCDAMDHMYQQHPKQSTPIKTRCMSARSGPLQMEKVWYSLCFHLDQKAPNKIYYSLYPLNCSNIRSTTEREQHANRAPAPLWDLNRTASEMDETGLKQTWQNYGVATYIWVSLKLFSHPVHPAFCWFKLQTGNYLLVCLTGIRPEQWTSSSVTVGGNAPRFHCSL